MRNYIVRVLLVAALSAAGSAAFARTGDDDTLDKLPEGTTLVIDSPITVPAGEKVLSYALSVETARTKRCDLHMREASARERQIPRETLALRPTSSGRLRVDSAYVDYLTCRGGVTVGEVVRITYGALRLELPPPDVLNEPSARQLTDVAR